MRDQRIVIFGGPDRCGKTTIAKALADKWDIPYFKPMNQQWFAMNDPDVFQQQTRWAEPKLLDFLIQTGHSAVIDRSFPCDWAYSRVLGRQTAWATIEALDEGYSTLNSLLVFTLREQYEDGVDEDWGEITTARRRALDKAYREYAAQSKMRSTLLVSEAKPEGWNLTKQLQQITQAISTRKAHE